MYFSDLHGAISTSHAFPYILSRPLYFALCRADQSIWIVHFRLTMLTVYGIQILKTRLYKKVMTIFSPGIQPMYTVLVVHYMI